MEILALTPNDLDLRPDNQKEIKTIRVKASATYCQKLERIFHFVMHFEKVETLIIDDDYIYMHDPETIYFLKRLTEEKPNLKIEWTYSGMLDGRHGRGS